MSDTDIEWINQIRKYIHISIHVFLLDRIIHGQSVKEPRSYEKVSTINGFLTKANSKIKENLSFL